MILIGLITEDERVYSLPYSGSDPNHAHEMALVAQANSSYVDHIVFEHTGEDLTFDDNSLLMLERLQAHPAILSDKAWNSLYEHFSEVLPRR